jgi:hypothetical protein
VPLKIFRVSQAIGESMSKNRRRRQQRFRSSLLVRHRYHLRLLQVTNTRLKTSVSQARFLEISGGEAGTTAVYTIDPSGKEVTDPIPDAPGSVRVAKSHWNDRRIVTEWQMKRDGEVFMHGTDTRRLTAEGLEIVDRIIESPRHHAEVHLVLERVH